MKTFLEKKLDKSAVRSVSSFRSIIKETDVLSVIPDEVVDKIAENLGKGVIYLSCEEKSCETRDDLLHVTAVGLNMVVDAIQTAIKEINVQTDKFKWQQSGVQG